MIPKEQQTQPYGKVKQEMDTYYTNDKNYLKTLEKIRPMMDGELERDEYIVFKYNMK
jgi:hypothetical protein